MEIGRHLKRDLSKLRSEKPLIHHLTNFVAMNDSANATLAVGASPIMAHAHAELRELISAASALLINIGTLDDYWIQSMHIAAEAASGKIPILLDPVGAGATRLRTSISLEILSSYDITVVKGNYGEMLSLMGERNIVKGVDSLNTSLERVSDAMKDFSIIHKAIAVATGKVDVVSNGRETYLIRNGSEKLGSITASGCMLGSVIASFLAIQKNPLIAALEGVAVYSIAGELADGGVGSFRAALLDSLSNITPEDVEERIDMERL
jgi:hydroxyethylthiazole kinase